jgi:hypothetical protein
MPETPTPTTKQTCAAQTIEGGRCQARVRAGRTYCYMHDPETAEAAATARHKGGRNRNKPAPAPPVDLSTPELQRLAIEATINRVRSGDEPLNMGRFVVYAVSLARPILELEDLAQRLAALEQQMGAKK